MGSSGRSTSPRYGLSSLVLDAFHLLARRGCPEEGVLVALGLDDQRRALAPPACLGQRERVGDWLEVAGVLIGSGLRGPRRV